MAIQPAAIKAAIQDELSSLRDPRVRAHIERLLVEPKPILRAWDYGQPGEKFLCWTVLEHPFTGTAVAYCEQGFGPQCPWGLVFLNGDERRLSIGMDSGWFPKFLQAVSEAPLEDLPIWRVFKTTDGVRESLTPEDSWDETWKQVMVLREADPTTRYDCDTDVLTVR
jgi:hypothetical protein